MTGTTMKNICYCRSLIGFCLASDRSDHVKALQEFPGTVEATRYSDT